MGVVQQEQLYVTKISSSQVYTTSRWGIKQLGISFGSIFLLFSHESRQGTFIIAGGNPRPPALDNSPGSINSQFVFYQELSPTCFFTKLILLLIFYPCNFRVCAFAIQRTQLSRSLEQATMFIITSPVKEK